jgi:hypothetical protein
MDHGVGKRFPRPLQVSILRRHVFTQTLKQLGKPRIPLVPVVTAWDSVKLEPKAKLGGQRGKFAVCRQ